MIKPALALAGLCVLASCAAPPPAETPQLMLQIDPELLPLINQPAATPVSFVGDVGVAPVQLGAGDVVAIAVIEPAGGGLYTPLAGTSEGRITRLPAAVLDENGAVLMPFAGKVAIGGLSPHDAALKLQAALARLAIKPQVELSLVNSATRRVLVEGTVAQPGVVQIPAAGLRVTDAIAAAGGISADQNNLVLELDRAGTTTRLPLADLLDQPSYNVHLRQNDVLRLGVQEHRIALAGALTAQNDALPTQGESLAQLTATAGHSHVYLLRQESRATALRLSAIQAKQRRRAGTDAMGNVLAGLQPVGPQIAIPDDGRQVPVVFDYDPTSPAQVMLAAQLPLRNGDVVYVPTQGQDSAAFWHLAALR